MEKTTIRFEQAALRLDQNDKIKVYETRFFAISRMYQKSPFMQMMQWDTYEKLNELAEPVATNDWSNYLFKKLDDVFEEVEDLQNDPKFVSIKENLLEMIKQCRLKNIL